MTEQEHLRVALRLNALADRLYQDRDEVAGEVAAAEMLWGAANRVLNAIALQRRLDSAGQLPRRGAVIHYLVSGGLADPNIQHGMYAAGDLHGHFYNSHLDQNGVAARVADTRTLIAELLNLYRQHGRR